MGDVPAMEDIYFHAYDDQILETVIYRYDADNGEVCEVGKVAGYFHNCKIDSEKKYITGVRSPWYPEEIYSGGSGMAPGILRYSLEDGTSVLLRSEQQMSIGNKEEIAWDYSFPFDNGEKMLMCYADEENNFTYLLYDLETSKAKKIGMLKKYITGVCNLWPEAKYDDTESEFKLGIVRYSLEDGTLTLLRSEQQMRIGNKQSIFWDSCFPFDNEEKEEYVILEKATYGIQKEMG